MSDVLSQNEKYTILSSEHGDSITLFWHQYMDQEGIQSWYFLQESWQFGKRIAVERSFPTGDDTMVLPEALSITVSVSPEGVITPLSSIKPAQARTSGTKVLL